MSHFAYLVRSLFGMIRTFANTLCFALVALVLGVAGSGLACAQDRLELGVMGGGCYYLGEFNPHSQFKNTSLAAGFVGRYIFTDRIAVKGVLSYNRIKGDYDPDADDDVFSPSMSEPAPPSRLADDEVVRIAASAASFKNNLIDFSVMAEVNFFSFDHMFRKDQTRFSPYLSLGLGATSFACYDDDASKKTNFVLSLPFGVGAKFKVNKLLRLGAEWTFHKSFTDNLDSYPKVAGQFDPADPYRNGVHSFTHNNDWFSTLSVMVTISLWPRSLVCNDGLRTFNKD